MAKAEDAWTAQQGKDRDEIVENDGEKSDGHQEEDPSDHYEEHDSEWEHHINFVTWCHHVLFLNECFCRTAYPCTPLL